MKLEEQPEAAITAPMAWLLFMDESGHDHQRMPYEVRGGFAIAENKLWPLIQEASRLENACFGARLHDFKSEAKGMHLLCRDRFKWAAQSEPMEDVVRQRNCRAFLHAGLERKTPRRHHFTAFGQACLAMADGIFEILERYQAKIFAAAVPKGTPRPPAGADSPEILRKDHVFLLERFFYFLEHHRQQGILVLDEVAGTADRRFVRKLEQYFSDTVTGRERATWIVPSPFFAASNMTVPVHMADVVLYALNWGYRRAGEMDAPSRDEIAVRFGERINKLKWIGDGYNRYTKHTFRSFGITCVPDLTEPGSRRAL
ncbi:MAG: hypothetical protein JWM59_851 [Verrucomicrobiales bacterium]|nr:hypothetical protein [Verrucomicrobiales bacterium]